MKILHVVSTYPPYCGGMGTVAHKEAARLAAMGHEVHVATLARRGEVVATSIEDGVTVHRCRAQVPYGNAGLSMAMVRLMMRPWDAVHLHAPFFGVQELMVVLCWLGWRPKKLVVTYHMDIVAHGFVKIVAWISRRFFLGTIVRRARIVAVAAMDYAKSSWLKDHWQTIESKIVELPFGVEMTESSTVVEQPQCADEVIPSEAPFDGASRGISTSDRVHGAVTHLFFLGTLDRPHYFKGLEVLLKALSQLRERSDWVLAVAGDGNLRSMYETIARELGLDGRVRFVGRVDDDEKARLYRTSDAFIFPSLDRSEAFGLVALEAQASGTPVIVSDLDGVRTVVKRHETGILVPPGDEEALAEAIVWMIEHPVERKAMGDRARQRVEEVYDWRDHIAQLETIYRGL